MADEPPKPSETSAARAIREAIERQRAAAPSTPPPPATSMDERAATVLRSSLVEQQAAADREAARYKVILIHIGCCALLIGAVVLRVTLLSAVLFVWGQAGFKPSNPVLARVIATLEPQKLDQLLSMRPAAAGNSLHPRAPDSSPPASAPPASTPKGDAS
jgi:hypothetical protein